MTHQYIFDYHDGDVYWCTADVGWVTGHSYIVYGPLANGATTLMFEGDPDLSDGRALLAGRRQAQGQFVLHRTDRAAFADGCRRRHAERSSSLASLRVLGSVGEPINPEAWTWYHEKIGKGRCPIVDTWWQTETGGMMIAPLPGATPVDAGLGDPAVLRYRPRYRRHPRQKLSSVDLRGQPGSLVIKKPWPGQMLRTDLGRRRALSWKPISGA